MNSSTVHNKIELSIHAILHAIGENPSRDGLKDTPSRVAKSYEQLFSGYSESITNVFRFFEKTGSPQIVVLKNIEFYSTCEHHMMPFIGTASIAYLPKDKLIGISKLARILDIFSRRLQIQERIGEQVTETLDTYLEPLGSACIITAKHLCINARGVQKQHSEMVTSSVTGVFLNDPGARMELMQLIK